MSLFSDSREFKIQHFAERQLLGRRRVSRQGGRGAWYRLEQPLRLLTQGIRRERGAGREE